MTKERTLLRRALEALKDAKGEMADWGAYADAHFKRKWDYEGSITQYDPLIEELSAYLAAEPEAEPVAWRIMPPPNLKITDGSWLFYDDREVVENLNNQGWKIEPLYTRPEPEAEPVAWIDMTDKELRELHEEEQFGLFCDGDDFVDISRFVIAKFKYQNRTKPAPARKPMTDEEIDAGFRYDDVGYMNGFFEGVRFAEKHHGISNEP